MFMNPDEKIAYLGFIQNIVQRMNANSFLLKGWTITLIAALFALAAGDSQRLFVFVCYLPLFGFWSLDGFFLRQERLFRQLYIEAAASHNSPVSFSLDVSSFEAAEGTWFAVTFSETLRLFYLPLFLLLFVISLVLIAK